MASSPAPSSSPAGDPTMRADMKSRLLMVLAALLLLPAFITPLWSIGLVAPQYPDGLGMNIYVHDVRGHERHDLQNINILNHYIGMQPIEPENIPELEIMPWVLAGIILTGVMAGALGRPRIMLGWLVLFVAAGVAGMVDFYLWNIDYGHNLSPDAPIRIPDMTYSPPIIGTAQLLNIRASSWPGLGTLFITVSILISAWAVFRAFRGKAAGAGGSAGASAGESAGASVGTASSPAEDAQAPGRTPGSSAALGLVLVALVAAASGCDQDGSFGNSAPGTSAMSSAASSVSAAAALQRAPVQPPASDADRMAFDGRVDPFCQVPIEEIRWGGVIETTGGETLAFASAACLAGQLLSGATPASQVARVRVVDFAQGEKLVEAASAHFLLSPNRKAPAGPEGPSLLAIETDRMAVNLQEAYSGRLMNWDQALRAVAEAWGLPAPAGTPAPYTAPR
jgi:copper chaperone NosL